MQVLWCDPLPDWLQPFDENLVDEEELRGDRVEENEDMKDDDQEREKELLHKEKEVDRYLESEDIESAVSSRAHATAAPIRPFVTGCDETLEQEGPESKQQRTVAGLLVCSLLTLVDEIPVSYVATHEIDDRPVCDVNGCLHNW